MKYSIISLLAVMLITINYTSAASPSCAQLGCGYCCDTSAGGQCYDNAMYVCNAGRWLCAKTTPASCGDACYDPAVYHCDQGGLRQGPESGNPQPVTQAPTAAATTQAPTPAATTQAPTAAATTQAPTAAATTQAPTTTTTQATTTKAPTTQAPTAAATTQAPTTTKAPTTAAPSTTLAPTSSGNLCDALNADCASKGLKCCQTTHPSNMESEAECYNPNQFVCTEKVMCITGMAGCGYSCYDPGHYNCVNEQLVPK